MQQQKKSWRSNETFLKHSPTKTITYRAFSCCIAEGMNDSGEWLILQAGKTQQHSDSNREKSLQERYPEEVMHSGGLVGCKKTSDLFVTLG